MPAGFLRLFAAEIRDISSTGARLFCHRQRFAPVLETASLHPPLAALRRFPLEGEPWNGGLLGADAAFDFTPQSRLRVTAPLQWSLGMGAPLDVRWKSGQPLSVTLRVPPLPQGEAKNGRTFASLPWRGGGAALAVSEGCCWHFRKYAVRWHGFYISDSSVGSENRSRDNSTFYPLEA